jgi:LPXTG-site transpeptidase (sortase) family protein
MFKNSKYGKYSDALTIILVVLIVVIIGLLGYFGYSWAMGKSIDNKAQSAMEEFSKATQSVKKEVDGTTSTDGKAEEEEENTEVANPLDNFTTETTSSSTSGSTSTSSQSNVQKTYLEGYEVLGNITIPKTNCKYPILNTVTTKSISIAVAVLYPINLEALNQPGNTVIVGHNYRNGLFFSNNYKLSNGDKIIIESATETVTYVIYNMYYTDSSDADYMVRNVADGVREISLSTCNDDSSQRLVIWAIEQGAEIPEV